MNKIRIEKVISDYQVQFLRVNPDAEVPQFTVRPYKDDHVTYRGDAGIAYGADLYFESDLIRMTETLKKIADHPEIPAHTIYAQALAEVAVFLVKKAEDESEYGMKAMYLGDASSFYDLAEFMNEGYFKKFSKHAQNMDTAARDRIPNDVYFYAQSHLEEADNSSNEIKPGSVSV
jgi:hypothetical protein